MMMLLEDKLQAGRLLDFMEQSMETIRTTILQNYNDVDDEEKVIEALKCLRQERDELLKLVRHFFACHALATSAERLMIHYRERREAGQNPGWCPDPVAIAKTIRSPE